ncbi:uncharacterized protein BT62DRAFT_498270 [Guyanagaster necrorhizus]|uniref:Uncharacterized protein n=1 Tax=Guyanagaster necrorhizus TaxID=856835 RepID=A0A9P7VZY3_9AGAR|nr:uncharacterized protein BT62DRAFT_498270 [Guyanagaster necrorhizus MCA 3950]KAG7450223.1 hypothetical protein BT62DRAFT_498270 [Guyanagaster necrorhizus MCA 3950]
MNFRFTPNLGQSVHIPISHLHTTTAELCFSATVDDSDYEQLQRDKGKVQLWSDLPVNGRNAGDWGETAFQECIAIQDDELSLGFDEDNSDKHVLSLVVPIPYAAHIHRQFSFTYRIVYPSGDVKWLGSFGDNGSFVLEETKSDERVDLLGEYWSRNDEGVHVWNTGSSIMESVLIAKAFHPNHWNVWAVGADSWVSFLFQAYVSLMLCVRLLSEPQNACLLFLVPVIHGSPILLPQTLVLSACQDTSIAFTPTGNITASGSNSVHLVCFDRYASNVADFIERAFAHCSLTKCQFLSTSDQHAVIASPLDQCPVIADIVPLCTSILKSHISIEWSKFTSLTAEFPLSLFLPGTSRVLFYDSADQRPESVRFLVPPSGGQFMMTPVYTLETKNSQERQFALLQSHVLVPSSSFRDRQILPTPPPSPHLHPVAHLSLIESQFNASSNSISEMGISSSGRGSPDISESEVTDGDPLVRKGRGVIVWIKHVLAAISLFFSLLVRKLFGCSSLRTQTTSSVTEVEEQSRSIDERTPLLSDHDCGQEPSSVEISLAVETTITAHRTPPSPLASIFVDFLGSRTISCILRDPVATTVGLSLYKDVSIRLGGKTLEPQNVRTLHGGTILFDLETGTTKGLATFTTA